MAGAVEEDRMNKRRWTGWVLELRASRVQVARNVDGRLLMTDHSLPKTASGQLWLTVGDARRLAMKLAKDY